MLISDLDISMQHYKQENTLAMQLEGLPINAVREDLSEYVAHLQLHMALQARNLVPTLNQTALNQTLVDSRENFLHQTQATIEKMISRQTIQP